jgi:hypothetical protein
MKSVVDLRPELGGKSFAQPAGVTIVEIDPETDELATGLCPQHERVAIAAAQAPTAECFRHSIYFALPTDDPKQELPALTKFEKPRSPSSRPKYSPGELVLLRDTRIETDKRGRTVLVNELKVGR